MVIELDTHPLEDIRVLCPDGSLGKATSFAMNGHVLLAYVETEQNSLQCHVLKDSFNVNKKLLFENQ